MNDEAVLDIEELLERVQGDKELLLELMDIYHGDFQEKRKLLGQALQEKDFEQMRSLCHSVKGASGNISAKRIRIIFMEIEDKAKEETIEGIEDLLSKGDEEFKTLYERVDQIRQEWK